jgi:hypothetical protein
MVASPNKYDYLIISFISLLSSISDAFRGLPHSGIILSEGARFPSSCAWILRNHEFMTTANLRYNSWCSKSPKLFAHIPSASHRVPRSGWPEGLWRDLGQPLLSIRAGNLRDSHINFIEKHLSCSSNRFLKIKVVLNGPCRENNSSAVARGISHGLMNRLQVEILQIRDTGILIARINALIGVLSLIMAHRTPWLTI